MTPAPPTPAASVLLVRPGRACPIEIYMIRRQASMRFLGGYYAFPGGKVDGDDATPEVFARCQGLSPGEAERVVPTLDGLPAMAFWVTAVREVLEETGLLMACEGDGRSVDAAHPAVARRVDDLRRALMAGEASLASLLAREGWYLDLAPLRYLSHFITPPSSPIRFSARFFLSPLPTGQAPRLFQEEASEGFWIAPAEGARRHREGQMAMAEPAGSGLAYLAQFPSCEALWTAHADGRHKFHGLLGRLDGAGPPRPRSAGGEHR